MALLSFNNVENRIESLLHLVDEVAFLGPVGPDSSNMVSGLLPEPLQKQPGAVSVLNVGSMDDYTEHVLGGVDDHGAFASPDVFSSVVASLPACFSCLDALTVDDRAGRLGVTAAAGSLFFAKHPVDPAPGTVETPLAVVKNSALPGGAFGAQARQGILLTKQI